MLKRLMLAAVAVAAIGSSATAQIDPRDQRDPRMVQQGGRDMRQDNGVMQGDRRDMVGDRRDMRSYHHGWDGQHYNRGRYSHGRYYHARYWHHHRWMYR
jgi:hypothetical protein